MKTGCFTKLSTAFLLTPALLIGTLPASAQAYGRDNGNNRNQVQQQNDRRDTSRSAYDRDNQRGDYQGRDNQGRDDRDRGNRDYGRYSYQPTGYVAYAPAYYGDQGYYRQDNGIGPGKGAAIGAVSGAVLGALVGGGKGALIGGAAGAGVGAIAGQAAQDHRDY